MFAAPETMDPACSLIRSPSSRLENRSRLSPSAKGPTSARGFVYSPHSGELRGPDRGTGA